MNRNDQNFIVQRIRTQYTEKEHSRLDALKELDARVKRPATIFAYVFGSLSAIVMGAGMSLVMTDIGSVIGLGSAMVPGIVVGAIGLVMTLINYPIYCGWLSARKKKYADRILKMSEELMHE